ncbi:hypothetical protein [Marilutibacter aestuarii]|nr:hypothetical protein [Lysobacter aestuarii]
MLEMLNLSSFGAFHTLIALVAVACGIVALVRHGTLGTRTGSGLAYVLLTVATSVTGLFIFRHGGFGPPHALAIMTLVALAIGFGAERRAGRSGPAAYVAALAYLITLFFHLIPGLTETGTRLPLGSPAFTGPEDPMLKLCVGIGFAVYLVGAAWQVARLRHARQTPLGAPIS